MSISAKITAFFISQGIVPDEDREVYEYGFELLLADLCKNRHSSPICTQFEHHPAGVLAPLSRSEAPMPYNWFSTAIL